MNSSVISSEQMALSYWNRLRYAALKEVEYKLAEWKKASPATINYWLAVHLWLEQKAARFERKASK